MRIGSYKAWRLLILLGGQSSVEELLRRPSLVGKRSPQPGVAGDEGHRQVPGEDGELAVVRAAPRFGRGPEDGLGWHCVLVSPQEAPRVGHELQGGVHVETVPSDEGGQDVPELASPEQGGGPRRPLVEPIWF